ncbi:hypothetical protein [Roseovarius confluentis]|uniref:hypothetical protein n=1 Tax=Roseovarius confluentis TaxID=1852027 RepID=UPI0011AFC347|nr:hypothetical protein [Roseovarius confluentis]
MTKQTYVKEARKPLWQKLWRIANTDLPPWLIKLVEWALICASFFLAVSAVFGNLTHPGFVYLSVLIAALSIIVGLAEAPGLKKLPSLGTVMIVFLITLFVVVLQFFGLKG